MRILVQSPSQVRIGVLFVSCWLFSALAQTAGDSISILIEQGHYKRAESMLQPKLQQNPDDPQVNSLMSKVAVAFQRWDEAIRLAEKAVAADGNRPEYHARLADALVSKLVSSKAGMFEKLSLSRRFRQEADIALKLDPKNADVNSDLVGFYLEAPGIAGGSKDKARELADRVAKLDPAQGFLLQAQVARDAKQNDKAEQFLKQAVQAAPNGYDSRVALADFYLGLSQPQFPQAEEQARQAINIDPQRAAAYTILSVLMAKQNRWNDLDQVVSESEQKVSDDLEPPYQAARNILLANIQQQLPRAENYFRKYLGQTPEAGTPNLAAAHWRLGLVLEKQGRKDEARTELQTAVKLDPSLKEAQQDLKRLK